PGGRKVKGTLHWVSAKHALKAEVRMFDHLFMHEDPYEELDEKGDPKTNPNSLQVFNDCYAEAGLKQASPGKPFQFLRHGYFVLDADSSADKMVFNRSVSLKDSWKKENK
ncbi:MAG: glutamine--tRNA ligase, partial [bacterium]